MQINLKEVKNCFEKSMDKYDENAIVQRFLAETLATETSNIRNNFGKILELGCGTGLLTREIVKKLNFKSFSANDLSEKSKKYLDKIISDYTYFYGNAQKINPNTTFDLIISNAMFQWFSNLDAVLDKYRTLLNKDGLLAFTTFSSDNFKELKTLTGLSLDYKSAEELRKTLNRNFEILKLETYTKTLEFNTPLELLYHMKNTGVNSLDNKNWTFADVKDFCENCSKTFEKPTLTYTPILVIAKNLN